MDELKIIRCAYGKEVPHLISANSVMVATKLFQDESRMGQILDLVFLVTR